MPVVTITREDVLRGKTLEPGWYVCSVKSVVEEVSKAGDSTNQVVDLVVESPTIFAGVPLRCWLNDKNKHLGLVPYLASFGVDMDPEKMGEGKSFDTDKTVGKKVDVYVTNGNLNGRSINQIQDFKQHKQ